LIAQILHIPRLVAMVCVQCIRAVWCLRDFYSPSWWACRTIGRSVVAAYPSTSSGWGVNKALRMRGEQGAQDEGWTWRSGWGENKALRMRNWHAAL